MDYKTKCQAVIDFALSEIERQGGITNALTSRDFLNQLQSKCEILFLDLSKIPECYNQFKLNKPKMVAFYGHSVTAFDFAETLGLALKEAKPEAFIAFVERLFIKDF